MLQQTQVATVVPYYNRWLRRFPTVRSLAATTESDVLHAWQGLGYYTRARNLHRCGKMIVEKFGGRLPNDPDELKSLPGIGLYTANAIAVFAFDQSLPIVEANTARVLSPPFQYSRANRFHLWPAKIVGGFGKARSPKRRARLPKRDDGSRRPHLHRAQSVLPNLSGEKVLSRG